MTAFLIFAIVNVTISAFGYALTCVIRPELFAPHRKKLATAFACDVMICLATIIVYALNAFLIR